MEQRQLPVSLTHDLILSAVFDLWFSSKAPSEAVLGMVYQCVTKKFPNTKPTRLPITQLPEEIRNSDHNLKYQPHLHFDIDATHGIAVGPKSIRFFVQKPYMGWRKWRPFIIEMWSELADIGFFYKIERTGLRFLNFTEKNLCAVTKTNIKIGSTILSCQPMTLRTELQEADYVTILQLASNAIIDINQSQRLNGSVIDIEVVKKVGVLASEFENTITLILDESHDIERRLFFDILEPEFVETLQPVYEEQKSCIK